MACNPQYHPAYNTVFNIQRSDQEVSNVVLYPCEQASAHSTMLLANCMEDAPCLARICAVPIALGDTIFSFICLLLGLVWSLLGLIFFTIVTLSTCFCWSFTRAATKDYASAVASNSIKLVLNLCFGPVLCLTGVFVGCKVQNCKAIWSGFL